MIRGNARIRIGILFVAMCYAGCSHSADYETVAEEFAFHALHLVDTAQTLDIARHPVQYRESSAICYGAMWIGPHPSQRAVWEYMGAHAVLHTAVTLAMVHYNAPRWAIRAWEATGIGIEAYTVSHNASIGLSVHL